jgi:anti-sigma regulatory factor (Ser/Thr protein kinase)
VKTFAASLGFELRDAEELAIVVSEMASNIVRHGIRGSIALDVVEDACAGLGLRIVARDVGPPFRDLATALRDGCDDRGPIDPETIVRRGGLGGGLGAIVRFTDSFRVEPEAVGKRICAVRFRARRAPG